MKETVYRCEICGQYEEHLEDDTLIGLNFLFSHRGVEAVPLNKTNKHICLECIDNLTELKKKLDAGEGKTS